MKQTLPLIALALGVIMLPSMTTAEAESERQVSWVENILSYGQASKKQKSKAANEDQPRGRRNKELIEAVRSTEIAIEPQPAEQSQKAAPEAAKADIEPQQALLEPEVAVKQPVEPQQRLKATPDAEATPEQIAKWKKKKFKKQDKKVLTEWWTQQQAVSKKHKKLPPGLQKKVERGGQLPPGWKQKLVIGTFLNPDLETHATPLPKDIRTQMSRAKRTNTLQIEDQIVRVLAKSRRIIDILELPTASK